MAAALALGRQIVGIVRVGGHVVRDPLGDLDPRGVETRDLVRIIGQQPDLVDAERSKHRRGMAIVARVVGEAEALVGVDRVEPAVLKRVSANLVGEADSSSLLAQIEQYAAAVRADDMESFLELRPAIALE